MARNMNIESPTHRVKEDLKLLVSAGVRRALPIASSLIVFAVGLFVARAFVARRGPEHAGARPQAGSDIAHSSQSTTGTRVPAPETKPPGSGPGSESRPASVNRESLPVQSPALGAGSGKAAPGASSALTEIYNVTHKTNVTSIARMYVTKTSFMTVPELEAAMRTANGGKQDNFFNKGDAVAIPGFLTEPIVEKPVPIAKDAEMRGIYLTGYTAGSLRGNELIRRWRAAGGNAVVFDVKDFDGLLTVPFDHPLAPTRRPLISNLPKFARFLHSQGLHAVARIALFRDAYQAENHSQMAVRSRRTGQAWRENGKLAWVDPSNPQVQAYLLALAKMTASSGVDEVQFDYVRFPAEGDQKDAEFVFQSTHPDWQRSDAISDFLARAYRELHPLGVLVSLDVFGVMAWQRPVDLAHTGQDIAAMARYCDVLSPMIYPSHFFHMDGYARPGDAPRHFISESMERFRAITGDTKVVLRPWLQAFAWRTPSYSPAYIRVQVTASKEEGGVGFLFWNARNDYSKLFPAMTEPDTEPNTGKGAKAASGAGQ